MGSKDRDVKLLKEAKKSGIISTIALAGALIFMGIQFWPVNYTYVMKVAMSTMFSITGFWILLIRLGEPKEGEQLSKFSIFTRWFFTIIAAIGIISAIVFYIRSAFSANAL